MAKSRLGQNFLRDPQSIDRIVAALGDLSSRTVVEIGPGAGAITERLATRAKRLIAIELDRELARGIERRFGPECGFLNVEVRLQDVLEFDFAGASKDAGQPLIVVGNLPYYITSPILLKLSANASYLDRAVLMVQREVADRITASPASRDYGLLTVTLQLYGRAESLFVLPPSAFTPPPEVHSTVFRWSLAPRIAALGVDEQLFLIFLRQSFAQKRKTLANNLRAAGFTAPAVADALAQLTIDPLARTETLTLDQLASLWRLLAGK
jgi:16S rRNA (adenine1518-N6/adenine1519-N6)-dimethyltransferase